jgi:hypothetical protein
MNNGEIMVAKGGVLAIINKESLKIRQIIPQIEHMSFIEELNSFYDEKTG